ncbi:MAG TPA: type II toxin-antitoxin system VapC family toxin [Candidatus Binatia bacterium]|nr:type II toxin-antitoxin system VapC family toxin [Candidatus Binatia bacterium]
MRYFNTSAPVKQYLQEAGSKMVLELLKTGDKVYTASLTYAETHAAFSRRTREGRLTRETTRKLALRFDRDWESYDSVIMSDDVLVWHARCFTAILFGLQTPSILLRRCFLLGQL